jgi:uncharacterized membrane protein YfcA
MRDLQPRRINQLVMVGYFIAFLSWLVIAATGPADAASLIAAAVLIVAVVALLHFWLRWAARLISTRTMMVASLGAVVMGTYCAVLLTQLPERPAPQWFLLAMLTFFFSAIYQLRNQRE